MSDADREKWDQRYGDGSYRARTHPSELLEEWLPRFPPGRALDIACGAGRNALRLAQAGYAVDAMDISAVAIDRGKATARERELAVNWNVTDLDDVRFPEPRYDLVVVARYVNRLLMPRLPGALREGGFLYYEHHILTEQPVDGPTSRRFRLRPNELLERFRTLRVLFYREGVSADPDGRRMALAQLIACKGAAGI